MSTPHMHSDQSDSPVDPDRERRARRWFLTWIIGFFIVFASVDALFVYIAVNTHTGEVSSDKGGWAKSKPTFKKAGDPEGTEKAAGTP